MRWVIRGEMVVDGQGMMRGDAAAYDEPLGEASGIDDVLAAELQALVNCVPVDDTQVRAVKQDHAEG